VLFRISFSSTFQGGLPVIIRNCSGRELRVFYRLFVYWATLQKAWNYSFLSKDTISFHSHSCCLAEDYKLPRRKKENRPIAARFSLIKCKGTSTFDFVFFIEQTKTTSREWLFDPSFPMFWGFRHGIGLIPRKTDLAILFSILYCCIWLVQYYTVTWAFLHRNVHQR